MQDNVLKQLFNYILFDINNYEIVDEFFILVILDDVLDEICRIENRKGDL